MELQDRKEISLGEAMRVVNSWFRFLLMKWKLLLLSAILGAVGGYLFAKFKKPLYVAECTFVLQEDGGSAMSQYAGLASVVGIEMGGGSGGGLFKASNIIGLYKSRLMLEKTLLSPVRIDGSEELLINRYFSSEKIAPGLNFNIPRERYTVQHDSLIKEVVEDVRNNFLKIENSDESPNIMSIELSSKDEHFSKEFTDKIVENVNSFYTETMTKKSQKSVNSLQNQADSVRRILNNAIRGTASAVDANPNPNPALRILQVPSQRKQVDVQAATAIYAETIKNLELARVSLRNDTPLIQIVDRPILPLDVRRIDKVVGILLGATVFVFLTVVFLLAKKFIAALN